MTASTRSIAGPSRESLAHNPLSQLTHCAPEGLEFIARRLDVIPTYFRTEQF